MASSVLTERIQAPFGGINSDAAPDYLQASEAPALVNLLPGRDGKVVMRGSLASGGNITGMTVAGSPPDAFWSFDDFALIKGNPGGGTKTWRCNLGTSTKTDVTATLVESPLDSRHARYGDYVYGAITDAAAPQLGRWDGLASAIVPQSNAPFAWTDLQVYANRLFVLGGTVPGTSTPVVNGSRVLFWSDTPTTGGVFPDLDLLASWKDDVSGLVNQIRYDGDDTPVGLAGCGRFMAIVGTRSINILTGSGASSFTIRNLTKNWGCVDIRTIVEVDDGFYFLSPRGLAFCDGTTVVSVSDGKVSREIATSLTFGGVNTAAMFNDGFLGLCTDGTCYLYHIASRSWTNIFLMDNASNTIQAVFRSNTYPIVWQNGGARRANTFTQQDYIGKDNDGSSSAVIATSWTSRFVRLASPGQVAVLRRLMFEYVFQNDGASATAFRVQLVDTLGTVLFNQVVPTQQASPPYRQRYQAEVNVETDAAQLIVTNESTTGSSFATVDIYDSYLEFTPAQNRATI